MKATLEGHSKDILGRADRKTGKALGKWGRNRDMATWVFSSLPSAGLSILDPAG